MDEKGVSSSAFADAIDVQRSSISHILSGRNKPSLDLIQKILNRYSDIDPGWLLTGKGNMKQLDLFDDQKPVQDSVQKKEVENPPAPKIQEELKEAKEAPALLTAPLPFPEVKEESPEVYVRSIRVVHPYPARFEAAIPSGEFVNQPPQTMLPPYPIIQPGQKEESAEHVPDIVEPEKNAPKEVPVEKPEKKVEKIMVFYTDKTFSVYNPSED